MGLYSESEMEIPEFTSKLPPSVLDGKTQHEKDMLIGQNVMDQKLDHLLRSNALSMKNQNLLYDQGASNRNEIARVKEQMDTDRNKRLVTSGVVSGFVAGLAKVGEMIFGK